MCANVYIYGAYVTYVSLHSVRVCGTEGHVLCDCRF